MNATGTTQRINVQITGTESVNSKGEGVVLTGKALDDTNSITEPEKVVPRTERVEGLGPDFAREFPPYSLTVLKLKTKWPRTE